VIAGCYVSVHFGENCDASSLQIVVNSLQFFFLGGGKAEDSIITFDSRGDQELQK
jgi:hypothetical protein